MSHYQRIACLCTESVETLYALGAEDCIAGISGFTVRPPRARKEKPKISGFSSMKIDRILAVKPDLVIGFCDLQADMCRDLALAGIEVHLFNQRSISGILHMVRVLAALVGREEAGRLLVADLQSQVASVVARAAQGRGQDQGQRRPVIYFEEWNEPLMSGIGWAAEAIVLAGGEDAFPELSAHAGARERIITDPMEVARRAPDIIIASWCGKKFQPESMRSRPGWHDIPAIRNNMLFEIKSPDILSPGPAVITEGLRQISDMVAQWQQAQLA
ncbi:ABC transporter substrate-binding protein [Actimicrobium sp. CCC2.4]|uniref:ABC transporter substrate-binding protein n=1 Tax=Actimicrobium sp. CCC2.4 TaxID=3048606 RepID=UPI002AC8B260|nr:ABC transporter substrate-binding protein [Actimicrobium sp. CCC2.4]MEB0136528.1 ABC transporter substrate-binding protein [Actimicrobium sp. CCC2.4]WPX30887.1 ABC transporter substrate-binding protein [Actimicrobium sp. CCC2.4]